MDVGDLDLELQARIEAAVQDAEGADEFADLSLARELSLIVRNKAERNGRDLYSAIFEKREIPIVQCLIDGKADVHWSNVGGDTALYLASQEGMDPVVSALLVARADVNSIRGDGGTALTIASERGHLTVVQALLAAQADVNHTQENGTTSLASACISGSKDVVRTLLDAKALAISHAVTTARHYGYNDLVDVLAAATAAEIEEGDRVFSVIVEIDACIPFEFVWPAVQDGVFRALHEVRTTWRELGWKSKIDMETGLRAGVAASGAGAIARGMTKADAERIAGFLQEVLVHVREDREGAAVAMALRSRDRALECCKRRDEDRERFQKVKVSLGGAALREEPELASIIQQMEEQLRDDDIDVADLEDIENFLDEMEGELGDALVGYSAGEVRADAAEEVSEDYEEVWSTLIHLDKEFPFDMVWSSVQGLVHHALGTCFPRGQSVGFRSAGEMQVALQKGVETSGRGPIARGLLKTDAERLMNALSDVVQCSVIVDRDGAKVAGSNVDLTELRIKLQRRLAEAQDFMSDLPPGYKSMLPRVEADLNDDNQFRKRYRDIQTFFDRIDLMIRVVPKYDLRIDREQFLNSALIPVLRASPSQLRPGRLHVKYLGEDAEDAGGVTRAFLAQAGSLLGDAQFGLFLPALRGYLQLNPLPGFLAPSQAAGDVPEHTERWCRFLGRILGMSIVHECPLGLLLVPSLCKRLLGQEISFEDLSFAPALNLAKGGGWYSSLKNMLAHRAPELVRDAEFLPRVNSCDLDTCLSGIEARMPSRSVQTFESMLEYAEGAATNQERWEGGIDVIACLLRGARTEEQRTRVLEVALGLLQCITSVSSISNPLDLPTHLGIAAAPGAHLNPSVGTWLISTPKKIDMRDHGLPRGLQRAYRMLFAVTSELWHSEIASKIRQLLHELLEGDVTQSAMTCESEALNIAGMWTLWDTTQKVQLYFEWVQIPGSVRFTGQEITEEGMRTISAGSISGSKIQWEIDSCSFSGKLANNGSRIIDGFYDEMGGSRQLGRFFGVLMQTNPELKLLRPTQAPDTNTWITVGTSDFASSSGKFYHEVKLGFDIQAPQLGWLTFDFQKGEASGEGVGDTPAGWAVDGIRNKFWHAGGNDCYWPQPWQGGDTIGLAVDIEDGGLRFSVNGEWIEEVRQTFNAAGRSIYPAVSGHGYFALHMSQDVWQFGPPDASYREWGVNGVLHRPPPLLDVPQSSMASVGPPEFVRQISILQPRSLERVTSKVPGIEGNELSAANLPAFAEAVARKTLVTNLQPLLGPITEEFRKITGEQRSEDLTWQQLQEMISGRQLDSSKWVQEWKNKTNYTFCDESTDPVQFWWSFVKDRSPAELPKLFEWCTNYPAIPTTAWKFRIQLLDDPDKLPSIKLCMTDDQSVANRGVPEPVIYLPPYASRRILEARMAVVNWQKGVSAAMTLV